jgi:hypothetical protein
MATESVSVCLCLLADYARRGAQVGADPRRGRRKERAWCSAPRARRAPKKAQRTPREQEAARHAEAPRAGWGSRRRQPRRATAEPQARRALSQRPPQKPPQLPRPARRPSKGRQEPRGAATAAEENGQTPRRPPPPPQHATTATPPTAAAAAADAGQRSATQWRQTRQHSAR